MRRKPFASEGLGCDADSDSGGSSASSGDGVGGGGSPSPSTKTSSSSSPSPPSSRLPSLLRTLPSQQSFFDACRYKRGWGVDPFLLEEQKQRGWDSDPFLLQEQEQRGWDSDPFLLQEWDLDPFPEWELTRLQEIVKITSDDSIGCQTTLDDWSKTGNNKYDSCKLGEKKHILDLAVEFEDNTIRQKIVLLSKKYDFFRPVDRDGNCFYRAFIFNYMEHIMEMQDDFERSTEAHRIHKRVEKCEQAYRVDSFGISEVDFKIVFTAFEHYVIKPIENGFGIEHIYQINKQDDIAKKILRFLRFLTEIEICSHKEFYKGFVGEEGPSVFEFCQFEVRPENAEASSTQVMALVNALRIPLVVANLDTSLNNGKAEVNYHNLYPRPESEEGTTSGSPNLHERVSSESSGYHAAIGAPMELQNLPSTSGSSTSSSSEALGMQSIGTSSSPSQADPGERNGNGDETIAHSSSPAEGRLLLTLLYRPGHYDILYPK
uniref:ubiquitinyl hydrolase 1 n=1 Tax=Leersia perrieri TaxID=77586 RepID=A0A0D9WAF6_9ORYZ